MNPALMTAMAAALMGLAKRGGSYNESDHPSKRIAKRYKKLRPGDWRDKDARKAMPWRDVIKPYLPKVSEELLLLFTQDRKARQLFEKIVSNFYLRPYYWLQLFDNILPRITLLGKMEGLAPKIQFSFEQESISPMAVSQFSKRDERIEEAIRFLRYSGLDDPTTSKVIRTLQETDPLNIFDVFGDEYWDLAQRFYREYFYRQSEPRSALIFWQLVLYSVIMDLLQRTTPQAIERAQRQQINFVENNLAAAKRLISESIALNRKLERTQLILTGRGELAIVQGQNLSLQAPIHKFDLDLISRRMLEDASANRLFQIKVEVWHNQKGKPLVSAETIAGLQYVSPKLNINPRERILLPGAGNQEFVYATEWVMNFMENKEFDTFFSRRLTNEEPYFVPVTILLGEKPDEALEITRISLAEAKKWNASIHTTLKNLPNGILDAIAIKNEAEEILGVCIVSTPHLNPRFPEVEKGQHHLVDISRIAVSERYIGKGIARILAAYVVDNAQLYNRSQYNRPNVITYSMLQESGATYSATGKLYPTNLSPPGAKHKGTNPVLAKTWKIRWESDPLPERIKIWLPKLHRPYMKYGQCLQWSYAGNCWIPLDENGRKLTTSDLQGLFQESHPERAYETAKDLLSVLGMGVKLTGSRPFFVDSQGASLKSYGDRLANSPSKRVIRELKQELIQFINMSIEGKIAIYREIEKKGELTVAQAGIIKHLMVNLHRNRERYSCAGVQRLVPRSRFCEG